MAAQTTHPAEPLVRIARREAAPLRRKIAVRAVAIVLALVVVGALFFLHGGEQEEQEPIPGGTNEERVAFLESFALSSLNTVLITSTAFSRLCIKSQSAPTSASFIADGSSIGSSTMRFVPKNDMVPAAATASSIDGAGPSTRVTSASSSCFASRASVFAA